MNVEDLSSWVSHFLIRFSWMLPLTLMISACSSQKESFISPAMQQQIDWTLSFEQLIESPSTYQGSVAIIGGEVLSAKRLKDHTQIIILQLPLSKDEKPVTNRTKSEGRFIAKQAAFLDPATIPPGTRVTVIGEISGSTTELLDEMEYQYPVLTIKQIEVWDPPQYPAYYYAPYHGPYYPYPYYWY